MMVTKVTLEINLVYPWSPPPCTPYKQVLMWVSPTLCERGGTNREVAVVTLLVATDPIDITQMVVVVVAMSSNGLTMSMRMLLVWATNKKANYETI
jgi:hypothetical protein